MFTVINKNFDSGIEQAFEVTGYTYDKSKSLINYVDPQGITHSLEIGKYSVVYVMNSSGSTIAKLTAKI